MSGDPKRVKRINTKKKFVADGVFQAELNEFLTRCLGMEGYAGSALQQLWLVERRRMIQMVMGRLKCELVLKPRKRI